MKTDMLMKHIVYPAGDKVPVGETLILSNNDQLMPRVHTRMTYFFAPSSSDDKEFMSSQVLQDSLAQTLAVFWPVTGKLKERENGGLDIECVSGGGVEFLDVRFESTFDEELVDYQPKTAVGFLLQADLPGSATPVSETPLLKVQLSRFKCGTVCLAVAMHHLICDGKGVSDFVTAWANTASGRGISPSFHLDRSVLKARQPARPSSEHIEYTTQPPSPPSSIPMLTAKLVEFTAAQIGNLKEQANRGRRPAAAGESKSFTAFEALAGHVWKCVTEARQVEKSKHIKLGFAIDGRERFVPPLPVNYFGNVNFYGCARANAGDLVSEPLSHAAACINEAKMRVDDEYMRSALDWVELQSSPLNIFPSFNSFCGSDLAMTSWSRFPVYEVDFGWGRPTFFGIPVAAWDGLVLFLPSQHGANSVNVMVGLTEQHMNNLLSNPNFHPPCQTQFEVSRQSTGSRSG